MGKVYSHVARFVSNRNIESRAFKELEKQAKDTASKIAPKHASTSKLLDDFAKENPELYEEQKKKNVDLLERLKTVKIDSTGPAPEESTVSPFLNQSCKISTERRMPESKSKVDTPEYGYVEPKEIPAGKVTIRQATDFINRHAVNPQNYTSKEIAEEYNLEHHQVQQVLKHFKYFRIHIPKELLEKNPQLVDQFKKAGPDILDTSNSIMNTIEQARKDYPEVENTNELANVRRKKKKNIEVFDNEHEASEKT